MKRADQGLPPLPPERPYVLLDNPDGPSRAHHVPPGPNLFWWFFAGLGRQGYGIIVALVAAYSAIWIGLWFAALGAILAPLILLGVFHQSAFTRALFHFGAGTSVTAVAVVGSAFTGAALALVAFYERMLSSPYQLAGALIGGAVLAFLMVVVIAVFEGNILALRGFRELSPDEVRRVSPLLQQIGIDMRLRNVPRFAMAITPAAEAWAHMRHIVLSEGLLDTLDDGELTAVLAHELHHWRKGDSIGQHFVWACCWPVALLYTVGFYVSGRQTQPATGEYPAPSVNPPGGFLRTVFWIATWPAWFLVKFPIMLSIRWEMRREEYEADQAVKDLGYGDQLIAALRNPAMWEGARTGWEAALYATHPPRELRIARLNPPRDDDADYQEPPLGAETRRFLDHLQGIASVAVALISVGAVLAGISHYHH